MNDDAVYPKGKQRLLLKGVNPKALVHPMPQLNLCGTHMGHMRKCVDDARLYVNTVGKFDIGIHVS